MDPGANLRQQRELAAKVVDRTQRLYRMRDSDFPEFDVAAAETLGYEQESAAYELAELVQALDEWRLRGGFDPYEQEGLDGSL